MIPLHCHHRSAHSYDWEQLNYGVFYLVLCRISLDRFLHVCLEGCFEGQASCRGDFDELNLFLIQRTRLFAFHSQVLMGRPYLRIPPDEFLER